jgi:hypothetical protein
LAAMHRCAKSGIGSYPDANCVQAGWTRHARQPVEVCFWGRSGVGRRSQRRLGGAPGGAVQRIGSGATARRDGGNLVDEQHP